MFYGSIVRNDIYETEEKANTDNQAGTKTPGLNDKPNLYKKLRFYKKCFFISHKGLIVVNHKPKLPVVFSPLVRDYTVRRHEGFADTRENTMEWEFIIHNDSKYIEVVTRGLADTNGSMEMAKSIAKTMRRNKITRALIDHRNITSVTGTIVDVYERPKLFKVIGMILGIKIAEIINPDHLEHFKFLETVCVNRGYRFSVFYERADALRWLLG